MYCSQNQNKCKGCSLVSYGRDCHNNPVHLHRCGHRATSGQEPEEMAKIDCYDCRMPPEWLRNAIIRSTYS